MSDDWFIPMFLAENQPINGKTLASYVEFVPPIFFLPVQLHCEYTETECPGVNLKNRAEEHVLYLKNMSKT